MRGGRMADMMPRLTGNAVDAVFYVLIERDDSSFYAHAYIATNYQ